MEVCGVMILLMILALPVFLELLAGIAMAVTALHPQSPDSGRDGYDGYDSDADDMGGWVLLEEEWDDGPWW
ncbi:MAG: hypothetical protein Kow00123_20310 [Anaerolineales bacterium]